jgi:hypothetical protein
MMTGTNPKKKKKRSISGALAAWLGAYGRSLMRERMIVPIIEIGSENQRKEENVRRYGRLDRSFSRREESSSAWSPRRISAIIC